MTSSFERVFLGSNDRSCETKGLDFDLEHKPAHDLLKFKIIGQSYRIVFIRLETSKAEEYALLIPH